MVGKIDDINTRLGFAADAMTAIVDAAGNDNLSALLYVQARFLDGLHDELREIVAKMKNS